MNNSLYPFVSVIIPVFNDTNRLALCLKALEDQAYPKDLYEVIVIDNASDESIEHVVKNFSHAYHAFENYPTSYAARNKGISLARGTIIAFTDSDCMPHMTWIENGVNLFLKNPNCGFICGKIELTFKNPLNLTSVELYEKTTYLNQEEYVKHRFGSTANLITSRQVIDKIGIFNSTLASGGDLEWGRRVSSYGYKLVYGDAVCVYHPARHSFTQLYRRMTRISGGHYELGNIKSYTFRKFFKNLIAPIQSIPRTFLNNEYSHKQKINYIFLTFFIEYATIWIRIHLQLFGNNYKRS